MEEQGEPTQAVLARRTLDALRVGIGVVDGHLVFRYANATLAAINDIPVDDHVGRPIQEVLPDLAADALDAIVTVQRTREPLERRAVYDRAAPREDAGRAFDISYLPITLEDGAPGVCFSMYETTDQVRARWLGERLARLRDANVVGVMSGEGSTVLDANDAALSMIGRTREEVAAGTVDWVALTPPEHREADEAAQRRMMELGDTPAFEKEFVHADGHRVPVLVAGVSFSAEPFRWLVLVVDVSTLRRAERRALALSALAAALVDATSVDEVLAHARVVEDPLSGLTVRTAARERAADLEPGSAMEIALRTGRAQRAAEGAAVVAVPVHDGTEECAGVVELTLPVGELDVHERSFASALEAVLSGAATQLAFTRQRRRAELGGALDAMQDMVAINTAIRDAQGAIVDFRVEFANAAMRDLHGRTAIDMVGRTTSELYPEMMGTELFEAHRRVVETGEHFEAPEVVYTPDDPTAPARTYAFSISRFGDGFIASTRDVTEQAAARREIERSRAQLEAAQRLARMGSWEWNLDTGERLWSKELHHLLEIDHAAPVDERDALAMERIHPDERDVWRRAVATAVRDGQPFRYDQRIVLPGGTRQMVVQGDVAQTDAGRVFRGTIRDVTDLRRARDESEQGRRALATLQRACLPDVLPDTPGLLIEARYRPAIAAERIGGDWYDAFDLPAGRLGLVVGDVTGHGLPAAVAMSQLRNALRALAMEGGLPGAVLATLGRFLRRSGISGFATCLYAVLDPATGALRWARAGHPPFVVVREAGWSAPEDGVGPPLGVPIGTYDELESTLEGGALLAMYTDGLVEERGIEIDDGIAQLADRLRAPGPQPLGTLVGDVVDSLLVGRSNVDDACLLLVRRTADAAAGNGPVSAG